MTNLLEYQRYLTESKELGFQVHSNYTDYSKAFKLVDHSLLVAKLSALGNEGMARKFFSQEMSNEFLVSSGVPQDCYCGPTNRFNRVYSMNKNEWT